MIQNRESTSHVRVCESRAYPVSIVGWIHSQNTLKSFIVTVIHDISKQIKHRARIGKIFARWHLAIHQLRFERIQRRAFRIIYPDLSYSVALETVGLPKLHERREKISIDLFDEIVCNPTHSLHSLLPQRKSCKYALRRKSDFTLALCKTERLKKSFIFSHVYKM